MNIYINDRLHINFSIHDNDLDGIIDLRQLLLGSINSAYKFTLNALTSRKSQLLAVDQYELLRIEKAISTLDTVKNSKYSELSTTIPEDLVKFDSVVCFSNLENLVLSLDDEKELYNACIDFQAGQTRAKAVSTGDFVGEEYLLAHAEATLWTSNGEVLDDVPASVSVWATALGVTCSEAAKDILDTRARFNGLLNAIRSLRLLGKTHINNCYTVTEIKAKYDEVVSQLKLIEAQMQ